MKDIHRDLIAHAKQQNLLSDEAVTNLKLWLENEAFSDFHEEIGKLIDDENWELLDDSFYSRVRVGTGGIRGPVGAGPNRINTRTIGEAAQALSNFMHGFGPEAVKGGIVIGHEVRKFSREFAERCCEVFAANGINSYLFSSYRATPELSFAVRHLKVTAGVQLTASHNPRTDNGFKFYWSDGGQVVPPLDQKFMTLVTNVTDIKRMPFNDAVKDGWVHEVGKEIDDEYFKAVEKQALRQAHSAKIAFSPMHGAGLTNVLPVLQHKGFDVSVVPEQERPDENFPTAHGDLINPEFPEVMKMPMALAEKIGADLAIMSDPDADRVGVAVKENLASNKMRQLSGNEVGIALTYYVLSSLRDQKKLRPSNLVIETYVTSSLISKVAKHFNAKAVDDLLVGFKFIGEIITKLDDSEDFAFAAEESLGYLRGDYARDKDAAVAAMLMGELSSTLKDKDQTVGDYLNNIYEELGYYKNLLLPAELGKGRVGKDRIVTTMLGLRAKPPKELAGLPVLEIIDLLPDELKKPENYIAAATGDQMTFILSKDGLTRVTARPSGTEPIIKFYTQHWAEVDERGLGATKADIDSQAQAIQDSIQQYSAKFIS